MQTLREWLVRLLATVRPRRSDADLEEELRLHMELAAEQAQRRGDGAGDAPRQARLRVGAAAQTMETLRDQRGMPWLEDFTRDVGYAWRSLRRSKGFAATSMVSLALGIGATAGIYSLVDQVLLRPLPVRGADRLVQLDWEWQAGGEVSETNGSGRLLSYPACQDLGRQRHVVDGAFCRHPVDVNLSTGGPPERAMAELVSGSYFRVLGVQPALGRLVDPSDNEQPGAHPVVVLSHAFWTSRLGAAPDVVGRQVFVNHEPMTVIGIAQAGFRGIDLDTSPALWLPVMMTQPTMLDGNDMFSRHLLWMHTFGRLRPDIDIDTARRRLHAWGKVMLDATARAEDFPTVDDTQRARFLASELAVVPASQPISNLRSALERPLHVLLGGTALLLLLAALNVAGLHLARGAARTRELTTRMALGASRGRVARQLFVESVFITAGGAVLGIAAAPFLTRALRSFVTADANLDAGVDSRVLLFAVVVTGATGILCGLAPILQVGRLRLSAALTDRSALGSATGVRLRKLLVTGQLALALLLLVLAGLFVQTLARLQARGSGFASDRLVMFGVNPVGIGFDYDRSEATMREVFRRVKQLPDVEHLGLANTRVLTGGAQTGVFAIDDAGTRRVTDRIVTRLRVTPGFFEALGAQVIDGRLFDERDVRPPGEQQRSARVAIVNETFARRYFGDRSPVGARLGPPDPDAEARIEIIGVVRELPRRTLRERDIDQVYVCYWESQSDNGAFYARTRHDPGSAYAAIRAAVASVEPRLAAAELMTFDEQIERSLSNERALATLSTAFGGIALVICIVGVYGVMAFVAARRTQEIGVRLAFGASRTGGVWVVAREALLMVGAGLLIAVPIALGTRRLIESQLYGIDALDGPTLTAVAGGLSAVALAAAVLPAWRAVAMPPMQAIRDQPESMWQATRQSVQRVVRQLTAPRDTSGLASAALIADINVLLHGSSSFAEAIQAALATLRERVGARAVTLLEQVDDVYRDDQLALPASGVLVNRLMHYPHPLLLRPEDLAAWRRWAAESRPQHLEEIDALERSGARMAVPLRTKAGMTGVLLLAQPVDRDEFTLADAQVLGDATDVFALLLENARLNARAMEQEKLRRDVAMAAAVQRRLLPPEPPRLAAIGLAAFTQPARSIGGDYYDFIELSGDRLGVAIADVAGKGVPAALLMSVVQASLRVLTDGEIECAPLAAKMNRFLARSTAANSYATFFYAQIEPGAGRLRYVNAGHNPPLLARRTAAGVDIQELKEGGTVLGLFGHAGYDAAEVAILPGDVLIAFTDGVTEARNRDGDEFGEDRVHALLTECIGASADALAATLAERVRSFVAGAEPHDDVTFVIATIGTCPSDQAAARCSSS
jgi:predicted permease